MPLTPCGAQEILSQQEMREVHAVLLGLAIDGETPHREGIADIYSSTIEDPEAPRLVTRLELAGDPCRARTITALQFPGQWASLTLGLIDLQRIADVTAYASVDDMIRKDRAIRYDDPRATQIVLTGQGLYCSSRVPLAASEEPSATSCGDRIDLAMVDDDQRERGQRALAAASRACAIKALQSGS